MRMQISVDPTQHPVEHLPFANEVELQRFVEDHAENIFGLTVISSTRRGGRRLFDIDILAVDSSNTPFIFECKWDLVDTETFRQLTAYGGVLRRRWELLEQRVSEVRRQQLRMKQREPILVAIGYRYDPLALSAMQSPICLTYAYHGVALTGKVIKERGPGNVSIQHAREKLMPSSHHPRVSKKYAVYERLAPFSRAFQAAFWHVNGRLCELEGVSVVYGGKNFVRYRVPRGRFAEARIGTKSIEWRFGQPGLWGHSGEIESVEMLKAADAESVFRRLRRTHRVC